MKLFLAIGAVVTTAVLSSAGAPRQVTTRQVTNCRKIVLTGEVNAGQEWKKTIGEGWVFRIVPINSNAYSGWDLVIDRDQPAGFPDALLLATPPYNSINEHEIGTTFGLRAQDAIGWNPRSFRFIRTPEAFRESQQIFRQLSHDGQLHLAVPEPNGSASASRSPAEIRATRRLMELQQYSSAGEFRILDARLAPGVSDAASYAENWALASPRTPHKTELAVTGKSTPLGELHWMRFSVALWLPAVWKTPNGLESTRVACSQ
jgi:hypothetical protein